MVFMNDNFFEMLWKQQIRNSFAETTCEYGIPSHVRTDHGGENVKVWRYHGRSKRCK